MPTTTTTYSFNKPVVGADEDDWGGYLNGNWDSVDDLLDGTTPVTGIDINSGTLDGVTIGGTTAGAGTFTTLTATTSITGTLATAAQTNITSVGTLTSLDVGGTVTADGLTVENSNLQVKLSEADGTYNPRLITYFDSAGTHLQHTWSSTASNLIFEIGGAEGSGTERMRIDSSGNVGIGTSLPSSPLTVSASASTVGQFITSGSSGYIEIDNSGGGGYIGTSGNNMLFLTSTSGTERMRIDSSGKVGIGTSSPAFVIDAYHATDNGLARFSSGDADAYITISDVNSSSAYNKIGVITHDMYFNTNNTERMRIDSSGNVGIGTSSPAKKFHVSDTTGTNLFRLSGANGFNLDIESTGTGNQFDFDIGSGGGTYTFNNSGGELMRIDSSGNLLVGKTSSAVGTAGHELLSYGRAVHTVNASTVQIINRLSNDGDMTIFQKDGTTVGSIGTDGNRIYIGTGDTGLYFWTSNNAFLPWNTTTNVERDNAIDLGNSIGRFKDLYLSGGVYLGGTGSANKLDDYEQGTFQATLSAPTSGTITISSTADTLAYVKVGRLVTITGMVSIVSTGSAVGDFVLLNNLPFTSADRDEFSGRNGGAATFNDNSAGTKTTKAILMLESSTQIRIYVDASTVAGSDDFYLSFSYQATS